MITSECNFYNPVNNLGLTPKNEQQPWQFSSTSCKFSGIQDINLIGFNPTTTISSSSDVQVYGAFSSGEIIISILLLLLILMKIIELLAKSLNNISTNKIFLQYGGGDVEVRKDL